MRDTVILGGGVFLGPYDIILETGDTQHIWWDLSLPGSQLTGPFWTSEMEKSQHLHDVFTRKTKPHKLKKMILSTASIVQDC